MNVPSFGFLALGLLAALLINVRQTRAWRRIVLLSVNVAFFASFAGSLLELLPFAALLLAGFASVKFLERRDRGAAYWLIIVAFTLVFCWLKRYAFFPHTLPFAYMTVGMSYVFFRILHLVIDAGQGALPSRIDPLSYINYTLNFTCLVAGPIQMYPDYLRTESEVPLPLSLRSIGCGFGRIATGFFKVSVVSAILFVFFQRWIQQPQFDGPLWGRIAFSGVVLILFPIYLYFNFSGYTDFVIGVARLLRLHLPENFDKPFFSTSVIEFWSRWHVTLSHWLRTYVYSPFLLSLMRRFPSARVQPYFGVGAYFVTFFLVGAWHGQTPKFLFFGLLTGLGISINKLYEIFLTSMLGRPAYRDLASRPTYVALSRGLTFLWFCFTMLWFWSSWGQLRRWELALGLPSIALALLCVFLAAASVLTLLKRIGEFLPTICIDGHQLARSPYFATAWYTALVVITLSLTAVLNAPAPHIVYRAF